MRPRPLTGTKRRVGALWGALAAIVLAGALVPDAALAQFQARGRKKTGGASGGSGSLGKVGKKPPTGQTSAATAGAPQKPVEAPAAFELAFTECEQKVSAASFEEASAACERSFGSARRSSEKVRVLIEKSRIARGRGNAEEERSLLEAARKLARGSGYHRVVLELEIESARESGKLGEFLEKEKSAFVSDEEILLRVRLLAAEGHAEAAFTALVNARKEGLTTVEATNLEIELATSLGNQEAAQKALARATRDYPSEGSFWLEWLRSAAARGGLEREIPRAEKAIATTEDLGELAPFVEVAEELAEPRLLTAVERRLETLSKTDDRALSSRLERLLGQGSAEDVDAALLAVDGRLRENPELARRIGALLLEHDRIAAGLVLVERAMREGDVPSERAFALALERAALVDEKTRAASRKRAENLFRAIAFERAKATAEQRSEARRHLVMILSADRRLRQEADAQTTRAAEAPKTAEKVLYRAELWDALGDRVQAKKAFEEAASSFPGDVGVLRAKLDFEERSGDFVLAIATLEQLGALDPARRNEWREKQLELLEASGELARAIYVAESMLAERPDRVGAWLTMGRLREKNGELREAHRLYCDAIERKGPDPDLVRKALDTAVGGETSDKLGGFLVAATGRVKQVEQGTLLVAHAVNHPEVGEDRLGAAFLLLLGRYGEDRELRTLALDFFYRVSLHAGVGNSRKVLEEAHPFLLALLARTERGPERRLALSILERVPPKDNPYPLLAFIRKSTDEKQRLLALRILSAQRRLTVTELEEFVLGEASTPELSHAAMRELAARADGLDKVFLTRVLGSEDVVLVGYALLSDPGSRLAGAESHTLPDLRKHSLVAMALSLREGRAGNFGNAPTFGLKEALTVFLEAQRIAESSGPAAERELLGLIRTEPLARSAALLAALGMTGDELRHEILRRAEISPSALLEAWRAAFTEVPERKLPREFVARHGQALAGILREALTSNEGNRAGAVALLSRLDGTDPKGPEAKLFAELLPAFERIAGEASPFETAILQTLPEFARSNPTWAGFWMALLVRGGEVAASARSLLERSASAHGAELLLAAAQKQERFWVEARRDYASLGRIAVSLEAPERRALLEKLATPAGEHELAGAERERIRAVLVGK